VTIFRKQRVISLKKAHFLSGGWSTRAESTVATFGKGMVPILTLSKPMVPTRLTTVITFREQPAKITGFCANLCFDLLQNYALRHKLAVEDFLQIEFAFPFDAIIGNPPFGRLPQPPRPRRKTP
jgi:hypothetical protein